MLQFKLLLTLFAICMVVIPKVIGNNSIQLAEESRSNSTEIPTLDTHFFDFDDNNIDLILSNDDEVYVDEDSVEDDSDFTVVYDKQHGYKIIPLSEMPQADEVIPAFDPARDVQFELYTLQNPNQPQLLTLDNYTTVEQSHFNWRHDTRILIHGW